MTMMMSFESGRFSPSVEPTEKEIGQQIVTCKLTNVIEPGY